MNNKKIATALLATTLTLQLAPSITYANTLVENNISINTNKEVEQLISDIEKYLPGSADVNDENKDYIVDLHERLFNSNIDLDSINIQYQIRVKAAMRNLKSLENSVDNSEVTELKNLANEMATLVAVFNKNTDIKTLEQYQNASKLKEIYNKKALKYVKNDVIKMKIISVYSRPLPNLQDICVSRLEELLNNEFKYNTDLENHTDLKSEVKFLTNNLENSKLKSNFGIFEQIKIKSLKAKANF